MNGLPAIAQHLASQGRNGDSVLVHMTPGEVKGLQALAEQHGTSLTINPDTGLPEAFSLRNLLPMIAGAALAATGIGAPMAALMVGGGTAVGTGSIEKGIMAGLGAYGGGSLAGAAGIGAAAPTAATAAPTATTAAGTAAPGAMPTTVGAVTPMTNTQLALQNAGMSPTQIAANTGGSAISPLTAPPASVFPGAGGGGAAELASLADTGSALTGPITPPSFMDRFAQAAAGDGAPSMYKTAIAGSGLMTPFYEPPKPFKPEEEDYNYEGPYTPSVRQVSYPDEEFRRRRTSEFTYFTPSNPVPFQDGGNVGMNVTPAEADVYRNIANVQRMAGIPSIANMPLMMAPQRDTSNLVYNPIEYTPSEVPRREQSYGFQPLMTKEEAEEKFKKSSSGGIFSRLFDGYKDGGVPMLEDGGFVLTKKAVDGLGKGDNKKGQKVASRGLGAVPIKGPGTGTSDSIRTTIEGKQPALVSNGEAYVPKRQVEKKGGAKKFYALMKAAERRA
jgi:hypothetical protein